MTKKEYIMKLKRHPILYVLVRLVFRVFRPLLRLAKKAYESYTLLLPDHHYHAWASQHEGRCFVEQDLTKQPLISVVVPLYNTPADHLLHMVYSIVNQHYENWELILVNGSEKPECRHQAQDCKNIDTRIKIVDLQKNEGISGNTNAGIAAANGEFIAFFDHDDLLHPCALHCVVEALQQNPEPDLLYTDEDKITDSGGLYLEPHCKPGWSPDLLCNVNYINHLTVMRTEHVKQAGGLRPAHNGAQDYDLLLRVIDMCKPRICHIPRVLYHWRAAATSTAQDITNKTYIFKAGSEAILEHLKRTGAKATVAPITGKPGFYKVRYQKTKYSILVGSVSVEKQYLCAQWIEALTKHVDKEAELIVGSWYKAYRERYPSNIPVKYVKESENYWKEAAHLATHSVVICFKAALLPNAENALAELAAVAADPGHGVVAPLIVGKDRVIVDAGIVDANGLPKQLFFGKKAESSTYFGSTEWVRNTSDVMTYALAMKTNLLESLSLKHAYARARTFKQAAGETSSQHITMWAHSVFVYKGMLDSAAEDSDYNAQLTQLTPSLTMHADNWEDGYERSE